MRSLLSHADHATDRASAFTHERAFELGRRCEKGAVFRRRWLINVAGAAPEGRSLSAIGRGPGPNALITAVKLPGPQYAYELYYIFVCARRAFVVRVCVEAFFELNVINIQSVVREECPGATPAGPDGTGPPVFKMTLFGFLR